MKATLAVLMLLGLALCTPALAQTNPPTGDQPATAAAPPSEAAQPAPAQTNAAPIDQSAAAGPSSGSAQPAMAPTNPPTGDQSAAAPPSAAAQASAVMPMIQFRDVQLTEAIENLARQAGINYILDPKVSFGQPGPDGRVVAQPTISLRWESVTAQQALTALLNNYNLQLLEDPRTAVSRITVKDPAAPDPLVTKIIQLKYAGPSNILAAAQTVLTDKRSKVVGDTRSSQLVVLATEKEMDEMDKLVDHLDTPTKQVLIEAKLMETSMNPQTHKGIDWSGTLQAQNLSYGNGVVGAAQTIMRAPGDPTTTTLPGGRTITTSPSSSSSTLVGGTSSGGSSGGGGGSSGSSGGSSLSGGLIPNGFSANTLSGITPNIGFLNADGLHAVLSFLNQNSEAKVISEPRTVTLDNETATLAVTRATPIINVTAGTANTTGGSQVNYTNLGVILNVTPRISANNYVNLKVIPEVSRLFDTVTKTVNGVTSQADEYDIRKMETHVMIPSGNTLVMGGLMQDDVRNSETKVPLLGDIPVLGYAFHSNGKTRQRNNLLIFITPTIVQESDFQAAKSEFLQTRPVEKIEGDWSVWDSAKQYDWNYSQATPQSDATYNEKLVERLAEPAPQAPPPAPAQP